MVDQTEAYRERPSAWMVGCFDVKEPLAASDVKHHALLKRSTRTYDLQACMDRIRLIRTHQVPALAGLLLVGTNTHVSHSNRTKTAGSRGGMHHNRGPCCTSLAN